MERAEQEYKEREQTQVKSLDEDDI